VDRKCLENSNPQAKPHNVGWLYPLFHLLFHDLLQDLLCREFDEMAGPAYGELTASNATPTKCGNASEKFEVRLFW